MPKGRSGGFVQDSTSTSLFSTTTGDQWSPLQPYSTSALRFPLPPQSTLSTAPLYGSLICLSLRRGGTQCRSGGFVWNGTLDVTFQQYRERPMVAPTTVFHLCSPFSLATPQSTLSTAPLYGR